MFPNKTSTKWYKIKESTVSNKNKEGPHIKFWLNISWIPYNNAKKIGAKAEVGRGIKKISFVSNLIKSKAIWKAPFLPITAGPIRRWAYAKNFLSVNTTNKAKKTEKRHIIKPNSLNYLKQNWKTKTKKKNK